MGQRLERTLSAISTSIWCKRIKSDLRWKISGDIITLAYCCRQEPLHRIGQDKRGGSFPFPLLFLAKSVYLSIIFLGRAQHLQLQTHADTIYDDPEYTWDEYIQS